MKKVKKVQRSKRGRKMDHRLFEAMMRRKRWRAAMPTSTRVGVPS